MDIGLETLSWLDWLALAVLFISVATAFLKGLTVELITLGSVLLGFFLAVFFYPEVSVLLVAWGLLSPAAQLIGFMGIFLVTVAFGSILAWGLDRALRKLYLKWIDRLFGGAFGLLRGGIIVTILFMALAAFPVHRELVSRSQFSEFFLTAGRIMITAAPAEFRAKFYEEYGRLYDFWIQNSR